MPHAQAWTADQPPLPQPDGELPPQPNHSPPWEPERPYGRPTSTPCSSAYSPSPGSYSLRGSPAHRPYGDAHDAAYRLYSPPHRPRSRYGPNGSPPSQCTPIGMRNSYDDYMHLTPRYSPGSPSPSDGAVDQRREWTPPPHDAAATSSAEQLADEDQHRTEPLYSPATSSPATRADEEEHERDSTPPPPPARELRDMPPLGSAKKQSADAPAPATEAAPPAAGASAPTGTAHYAATERANLLLERGVNPLHRHLHPQGTFVRNIRTRLCLAGAACPGGSRCSYAHSPEELLTREDNELLVEVAREWEANGIPDEWKEMVAEAARQRRKPPASSGPEFSSGGGPRRSKDPNPMAPHPERGGPQSQSEANPALPASLRNEELEVEEQLMKLITVRTARTLEMFVVALAGIDARSGVSREGQLVHDEESHVAWTPLTTWCAVASTSHRAA